MSRPLSLAELHVRNLQAKANLPRKPPSPSRHDGPDLRVLEGRKQDTSGTSDIFDSSLLNTIDIAGSSEPTGSSVAHIVDLVSDESGDEAVAAMISQPSQKQPSVEREPPTSDLMGNGENAAVEAAVRRCLEALQLPPEETDKCDKKLLHLREEGSHLNHIENEEKGCVNKDLQRLRGDELICRKSGSAVSSASSKCGRISRRSSSVSSSGSKSSSSRLRQENKGSFGHCARSNSKKRGRSSSRHRGRSRCRLRSNSRGRSMSGHRARSRSRHRLRSRSRPRTRSGSRSRVGSYSKYRGPQKTNSGPRGRSRSRTRSMNISKKKWPSSSTNKGKSTTLKRSKSPVFEPHRLILEKSKNNKKNDSTINVTLFNHELKKKKLDVSLGSLIQSSAKKQHQQGRVLTNKKNQALKDGVSSRIPSQVELTNGVKGKEHPLAASLNDQKVESSFSPAIQRFLETFNRSGLDPSEDDASDEENKCSRLASKSQKGNIDGAKEKNLESSCDIEDGALLNCAKNGTLPKLAPPADASVQRDPEVPKALVVNQQSPAAQPAETSQEGRPPEQEYEAIQDILKKIGLNIGVTEICRLSDRAQGRRNVQKVTAGSPAILSEVNSPRFGHKSPAPGLIQQIPAPVLELQAPAATLEQQMKGPILAKHHSPVYNAPPIVNAPTPISPYHPPNYTTAQVPHNFPPLIQGTPPAYGQYMPAPGWTSCPLDQPLNNMSHTPTLPLGINVTTPNVGTVTSMHLPIPVREPLSDEKNNEFEKQKVTEERQKLKTERETRQNKIAYLEKKLGHIRKQLAEMYLVKHQDRDGHSDQSLKDLKNLHDYLFNEFTVLGKEETLASEKQAELDAIAEILGGKPRKQSTDRKRERSRSQEKNSKRERSRSQDKTSRRGRSKSQEKPSRQERSRSREKISHRERSKSQERTSKGMKSKKTEKSRPQTKHSNPDRSRSREKSTSPTTVTGDLQGSCQSTKSSNDKTSKFSKSPFHSAVQATGVYEYYDAGSHWCRECNAFCGTLLEFFSHLHHKKHQQTLDPDRRPWDSKTLSEMNQETTKDLNKVTVPAKGSEFVIPTKAFYCTLCSEILGDKICIVQHVKGSNHNQNYKKYIDQNLLYEERRNLDQQAGRAAAMEAKHRRDGEMKHKLEEDLKENEKGTDPKLAKKVNDWSTGAQNKVTISKDISQKILNRNNFGKQQDIKSELEKSEELQCISRNESLSISRSEATFLHTADKDVDGNTCTNTKTTTVQDGKLKPISITIAKKPVPYMQAKIRPDLPVPCMVQRKTVTANIVKPAPLNTFLSMKSGPTTKPLPLATNVPKPDTIFVPDKPKGTDIGLVPLRKTQSSLKELVTKFSDQTLKPTWRLAVEHRVGVRTNIRKDPLASDKQEPTTKFQIPAISFKLGDDEVTKETRRDNSEAPNSLYQMSMEFGDPLLTFVSEVKQSNEKASSSSNLESSTSDRPTNVIESPRSGKRWGKKDPLMTAIVSKEGYREMSNTVPLSLCQEFAGVENGSEINQADFDLKPVSFPIAEGLNKTQDNQMPINDLTIGDSYTFTIAPRSDLLDTQINIYQKPPRKEPPEISDVSETSVTLTDGDKQEEPVLRCLNGQNYSGNLELELLTQQLDVQVSEADELLVPEEDSPMHEVSNVNPALNLSAFASDNFRINVKVQDIGSDAPLTSGEDHSDASVVKLIDQVVKVQKHQATNYFSRSERTTTSLCEQSQDLHDSNPGQTLYLSKAHSNILAIEVQDLSKVDKNTSGTYSETIVEHSSNKSTIDESSVQTTSPFVTKGVIETVAVPRTPIAKDMSGNVLTGIGVRSSLVPDCIVDNPNSPEDPSEEAAYLSD